MAHSPLNTFAPIQPGSRSWRASEVDTGVLARVRIFGSHGPPTSHLAHQKFRRQRCCRRQPIVRAQQDPRPGSKPDGQADFPVLPEVPSDYVWGDSELQEQFEEFVEFEQTLSKLLPLSKFHVEQSKGLAKLAAWLQYRKERAHWHAVVSRMTITYNADSAFKRLADETAELMTNAQKSPLEISPTSSDSQSEALPLEEILNSSGFSELLSTVTSEIVTLAKELHQARPAHERARQAASTALLGSALLAALNSALFGINFQEQWRLPQTWSSWGAFTAVYLLSLVSITSLHDEGSRGRNMQQLAWFPRMPAQPGWTPLTQIRQAYADDLAALDLRQAAQFAAAQAFKSSIFWRGVVLVLVHSVLHGNGTGGQLGLQGSVILQSPFSEGLVALPSLAQSQLILEAAAITAVGEALLHEARFTVEAWVQPRDPDGDELDKMIDKAMTEYAKTYGEPGGFRALLKMMKALGLSWSVERMSQHALVSLLLALQFLVTGSLPGAMLTEALGYMLGWQNVHSQPSLSSSADE